MSAALLQPLRAADPAAKPTPKAAPKAASKPLAKPTALPKPAKTERQLSFRNDILPILSRSGCNTGSCHAKADGRNGFKLSVFAFDPAADYKEIVKDARGRRIFPASPEHSLLMLKATQSIEHEGGSRFTKDSAHYKTLLTWIRQGMPYEIPNEPQLTKILVTPPDGKYKKGSSMKVKVTAHYSDSSTRDVTALSHFQSNDKGMVKVDENGSAKMGGVSGEGVIVVRYLEQVDVARVTIPPEKTLPPATYAKLQSNNQIDTYSYERHKKLGLLVSPTCSDNEFIRRATLDTLGKLPSPQQVDQFLKNKDPKKRSKLIDELLSDKNSNAWGDYWATKFNDLLRPNTQRVGIKPVYLFDQWIREKLRVNTPYDQFVRELLTASGSTHEYGPTTLFRDKREAADMGAFVSRIFLGIRMDCAKCHHHPNEKWGQDDYYSLAAFFGSVKHKGQGISPPISGEPEYIYFKPGGQVKHPVTQAVMKPKAPDSPAAEIKEGQDPREVLVDWITHPENPFFARTIVNRIWGEYFGKGIVHPVDDFRASNPATNDALLDWLATDFIAHQFDLKHLMGNIMRSHTYQISSLPNEHNLADINNFSRSYRRRLPAEVMLDAVSDLTGAPPRFSGLPKGSPAMRTWNNLLKSDFLDTFGRPDSSAACPCERDAQPSAVQALHMMNSKELNERLGKAESLPSKLVAAKKSPKEITRAIYLATYSRLPNATEQKASLAYFKKKDMTAQLAAEDILWSLLNSAEFVFNH
ncbi:MAG: DUF1549 and DUF1553 domain-containing protein [Verrucomicrobiota bacterium]